MENKDGYQPSEKVTEAPEMIKCGNGVIIEPFVDTEGITIKISGKREALMMLDNIDIYFK